MSNLKIDPKEYQKALEKYEGFKEERKYHIESTFRNFDTDNSNVINVHELESVLSSMGIFEDSEVGLMAKQLISNI